MQGPRYLNSGKEMHFFAFSKNERNWPPFEAEITGSTGLPVGPHRPIVKKCRSEAFDDTENEVI